MFFSFFETTSTAAVPYGGDSRLRCTRLIKNNTLINLKKKECRRKYGASFRALLMRRTAADELEISSNLLLEKDPM